MGVGKESTLHSACDDASGVLGNELEAILRVPSRGGTREAFRFERVESLC